MRKNFIIKLIIFLTIAIAIVFNIYTYKRKAVVTVRDKTELETMMPDGSLFVKKDAPYVHYEVYDKDSLVGYSFYTKDIAPEKKGFNGPIEMIVCMDTKGKIINLKVLRHTETAQYANVITEPRFLGQFIGKSPADKFTMGEDIDAITHATISSKAVSATLKACLERMQAGKLKERYSLKLGADFYLTIFIITFLLAAYYLKISWLRRTGLFVSIIYFGFIKANFISMAILGNLFLWRMPDVEQNLAWYVFIFGGIALTFFISAFYCSYMCPFGAIQIFLNKIFRCNVIISPVVAKSLRKIRYFLLWAFAVLILFLNNPNAANYEPFATVFLRRGSIIAWSIAVIVLILSLIHYRPFCNYFCGAGALMDMVSRYGLAIRARILKKDADKR